MLRTILHCDLNNFYASAECINHPQLKEVPLAVGGSPRDRHGIILAKNERAKAFGVKTGEPLWQAFQKCPALQVVPPHRELYQQLSLTVRSLYRRYTDRIESFGIDECWLDLTGSTHLFGDGIQVANQLRREVREEVGLTLSVGVSFNKVFAKLGSDLKKPDATSVISPQNFHNLVWPLPIQALLGVGGATARRLRQSGINTVGELAQADPLFLQQLLGKNGGLLWRYANGRDLSPVAYDQDSPPPKSIGNSVTCPHDLTDPEEVFRTLLALGDQVARRMRKQKVHGKTLVLWVKSYQFITKEYSLSIDPALRSGVLFAQKAMALYTQRARALGPVRTLGIRISDLLSSQTPLQLTFWEDPIFRKKEAVEAQADALRARFPSLPLNRASLLARQYIPSPQIPSSLPPSRP